MELTKKIRQQRRRLGLDRLTMRTRDGELVICTDSEAVEHNERKARNKAKGYVQTAFDNIAVDESKLTPTEREVHQRIVMRQAMVMRGIRQGQHGKLPELTGPPERVTPKMIQKTI